MTSCQDALEYAGCEATVKAFPPFVDAMKRRGINDMDLVMVDAWYMCYKLLASCITFLHGVMCTDWWSHFACCFLGVSDIIRKKMHLVEGLQGH